jgi:thiol-disulfide isomerase/thioredoxin
MKETLENSYSFAAIKIKFILLFAFFFLLSQELISQKAIDAKDAQTIELNKLIDYRNRTISLGDKNVLLDFWFAGCKPCIDAVPQLNMISESYPEDQVIVVSINPVDNAEVIDRFVKKYNLKTHIVSDLDKELYEALEIKAMPTVVLIDKNHRIRWKGVIEQIDGSFLHAFLKNDIITSDSLAGQIIYSFDLRHSADRTISSVSFESGEKYGYTWKNRTAKNILGELVSYLSSYDDNTTKYFIEGEGPSTYFDFSFRVDSLINPREMFADVLAGLSSTFGYSMVERPQDVYRLKIVDKKKLKKAISPNQDEPPSVSFEENSFVKVTNLQIVELIEILTQTFTCAIETQEPNSPGYDFNIPVTKDFKEFSNFLKLHGIELTKTGKTINTVHLIFTN